MNKIRWMRPTESGLCDRLIDLHWLAAYARVRNAKLYTKWGKFQIKKIDAPHRSMDIRFENVREHIYFPEEIVIDDHTPCEHKFNNSIGAAAPYLQLWQAYCQQICSWDVFEQALKDTAKGFRFCKEIEAVLATLPEHFCSLHVRRGDKVRDEKHDGCFIETHELARLNYLTFRSIWWALKTFKQFFVCGDEDSKLKPFVEFIREQGGQVIEIPQLEKWRMTYYDVAVMTKSKLNITSQRRSSFSSFPAVIGGNESKTVYTLEEEKVL